MRNKYQDLIEQTFEFPQGGFEVIQNELHFHGIPLMDVIHQYGTPLKLTYLPKITQQIQKGIRLFHVAMAKVGYAGSYTYCYCTKSSHFSFVLEEVLKNDAHIETSSAYDFSILDTLHKNKQLTKDRYIICNGYKTNRYLQDICAFINKGFKVVPVLDNKKEIEHYDQHITGTCDVGIRIASEETPSFEFYTSRLGIRHKEIKEFYLERIKENKKFRLKMLHFFINTGIEDTAYYWSELLKALNVYHELKTVCPELDSLNIGGGLPVQNSLGTNIDYDHLIGEIVAQIKNFCLDKKIEEPNLFTEFGAFTVAESGMNIYSIVDQKQQNDTENWYMIDNSFINTLPDSWGLNHRFILLAVNRWNEPFQRINLGGLTCDSDDYYNSEAHVNQVFLPKIESDQKEPLYIAFFNTGAYQDAISGFGGIKHCLIPAPKHVILSLDENAKYHSKLFSKEQSAKSMLKILGY